MSRPLPYDDEDPKSIEEYAKRLLNRSLREVIFKSGGKVREDLSYYGGKGQFGQLVEKYYFFLKLSSSPEPDFPKASVELKTSPLIRKKGELRSKERLVLNLINYYKTAKENNFYESSFWKKNKLLLLMLYLWKKGMDPLDYIFKIVRLWDFPEEDLKIIRDDWKQVIDMIKKGRADELSERFTLYLGACPKGASKESKREQPYGRPAMQRAFALKSKYLNMIIEKSLGEMPKSAPAISLSDYQKDENFEDVIIRKISRFYGLTERDLKKKLSVEYSPTTKHRYYLLAKAMLGVTADKIEEFEKADIALKAIRLKKNGKLKESVSFKQIKFIEIVDQSWEESDFYNELNRRFFFIVFKQNKNNEMAFFKALFWSIPERDFKKVKMVWEATKKKISAGKYDDFVRISDERVAHVRPKAKNVKDVMETPQGTFEKKKCFWLNAAYIESQLKLDS